RLPARAQGRAAGPGRGPVFRMNAPMKPRLSLLPLSLAAALLIQGCATTSTPASRDQVSLPTQWDNAAASAEDSAISRDWWAGFNSATLQSLIDEAQAN